MLKKLSPFYPPLAWFLLCTVLFVVPGSSLPKEDWLDKIAFDKWVHTGLFASLVFLSCRAVVKSNMTRVSTWFLYSLLSAIGYGIAIEFIQEYLVINRSFDVWDIAADIAGAFAGFFFSRRIWVKK